jgi:hypothetical protein
MNLTEDSSGSKLYVFVVALSLLVFSFASLSIVRPTYAATIDSGVVVPLYNSPGSTWTTVASTAAANPNVPIIVIVNPDSGPGSSESSSFLSGIQSLQAAHVTVLGYVATDYGGDSLSSVESQVSQYKTWYNVNGIFFDEMSDVASDESYYSSLNSYVKSDGMTFTMGNPGTSVPSGYNGIFNSINIYEASGYPTLAEITNAGYPVSDFSFMAYGVSYSASFVTSAASLVGYMYIDNLSGSNPYSTLSSLFTETVATLAALDVSTSGSTASSTTSTSADPPTPATTTTTSDGSGIALTGTQSTSGTVSSSPYQITLANFNVGTGSDRLLVVGVSANDESAASITFGGTALTRAGGSFYNNDAEFWYLVDPTGAASIVVTMAGSTSVVVGAYSLSGVSQTDPIPVTAANDNRASSSPKISITTKYSDSWVLDLPSIYGGATLSRPTCSQQWDVNIPNAIAGASSSKVVSSPGAATCSWTASARESWDDVAIEVNPSTPSSTTTSTTSFSHIGETTRTLPTPS